jgi:BlaI family transcriptional regulator, penicillinase repressor
MARPRSTTLTEGEQRIMEVLWELGEASVQEVTDVLAKRQREPVAYTTVLTVLRILNAKNHVDYRKEGKAHVYVPVVSREAARNTAVHQLLKRFFAGSPQALAQHLLQAEQIDTQEHDRLRAQVRRAKGDSKRDSTDAALANTSPARRKSSR